MIGTVLCLLGIILAKVLLSCHSLHRSLLLLKDGRNIDECIGDKFTLFRLMRLEQEEFGRPDSLKTTGYARSTGQQTRSLRGRVGYRVIWIKRVLLSMGDNNIRSEFANQIGQASKRLIIYIERIIAQIKTPNASAAFDASAWRMLLTFSTV